VQDISEGAVLAKLFHKLRGRLIDGVADGIGKVGLPQREILPRHQGLDFVGGKETARFAVALADRTGGDLLVEYLHGEVDDGRGVAEKFL